MLIPSINDIPDARDTYLGVFTSQQLYDPGWSSENKSEVYGPRDAMTANTRNFIRVKDLWGTKEEYIISIKSGLILDGGRRTRFPDGDMSYGTKIYARNAKKSTHDRLYKYADGRCDYDEYIYEDDWKITLKFRFNESSLTWTKLNLTKYLK